MIIFYMLSLFCFILGFILFFCVWYLDIKKRYKLIPKIKCNYCIIIPAKDESKVITKLLDSIYTQTKNFSNIYVIVENKSDKTCSIVKKYNGNIIVRKNLEGKRNKGFALDEGIKTILSKKKYNLYLIVDADTTLDNNYIKEMIKSYKLGYQVILPYKNSQSCNNVIESCSALTFSFVNNIVNQKKAKLNHALLISGSGIGISDNLINKWKGYPFTSLTEDYELSLYCSANNVPMIYNKDAICFIDNPTKLKESVNQRSRWIKGFFESRKNNLKNIDDYSKIVGILPHLLIIIGCLLFILTSIIHSIYYLINSSNLYLYTLFAIIINLFLIYIILCLISIWTLLKEKKEFNISKKEMIKAVFFNPIFLSTYLWCLIKSFKNNNWTKIDHK